MGISNLLKFLSNSTRDAHISEFENQFVAIDAYCWIHKGIYCCAVELAMKKPTTKYVTYCMRYIEMLHHFKIKPILVFDGRILSSKKETEQKRKEDRQRKYKKGIELIKAGQINDGRKLLGESVDVTHELVVNLIKECRKLNIDCIVAPFEADAQLAYFSLKNIVKCIITEDSDLLAYGCDTVMFKMDTSGLGKLIEKSKLYMSLGVSEDYFNDDKFRHMCILSGCDYLPSLSTIGPANALKFIKMTDDKDVYETLPKLPLYLNKLKVKVSSEYITRFRLADNTFKHQLVYDPFMRKQVPLRPVSNEDNIVGEKLPDDIAFQLAIGNIDPITMRRLDDFDPDKVGTGFDILWKTDLLPNAVPIKTNLNSSISESKKRHLEVLTFNHDLKKQRIPKNIPNLKPTLKVPETGFIFEPKVLESKKKISAAVDDSKLLNSRYFFEGSENKQLLIKNDRRKDETYEDYLQRLYNEYFDEMNDNQTAKSEENNFCCKNSKNVSFENELCLFCNKCSKCCKCATSKDSVHGTQQLNKYIQELEEHKKNKKAPVAEHFLLDEICKYETQEVENLEKTEIIISNNSSKGVGNVFVDFDIEGSDKSENEKENQTIDVDQSIFSNKEIEMYDSPPRSVQSDKTLKTPLKLENPYSNSTTSVYFSSSSKNSSLFDNKNTDVSQTPLTSKKISSMKRLSSVSSKYRKSVPNNSSNKTLFQFGFKKESKEGIVKKT